MRTCFLILVTFLFALPAAAKPVLQTSDHDCGNFPVVSKLTISVAGAGPQRGQKLKAMAAAMIRLKTGACFSDDKLLTSIALLKQTGQFSAIDVPDPQWDRETTDVVFNLTAAPLVQAIAVKGAFPVFKDEVIDKTDYQTGRAYNKETRGKNISAIRTLFIENGYINPGVDILAEETPDSDLSILITIDKGDYYKLGALIFNGNSSFSDTRLKLGLKSYNLPLYWGEATRFIEKDLKKDLKRLTAFYRRKGFAEVKISHEIIKDDARKTATIKFFIQEGPRYKVKFSGNREFYTFTLKKDLVIFKKGNINDFGLKRSIKNIRTRYLNAGYPDAEITGETRLEKARNTPIKSIRIAIKENQRRLVNAAVITGQEQVSTEELEKEILTRKKAFLYDGAFVAEKFSNDTLALENYYTQQGFEGTRVTADIAWSEDPEKDALFSDVVFTVKEGYRRTVHAVTFQGSSAIPEETLRKAITTKPGAPYLFDTVRQDRMTLLKLLSEQGFIHARVEPEIIMDDAEKSARVVFTIAENNRVETGGLWYFGNFRTREKVLSRYNEIPENEPVSLNALVDFQKTVRDINCLKRANIKTIGIKENLDQLFLIAEVEEEKPYYLEANIGYDTAKDAYISVSAGDRNFLGMNRVLFMDADYSGIGYSVEIGQKGFDFLSQRIKNQFSVYASEEEEKNQDFGSRSFGAGMEFEKVFYEHLTAGTAFRLESREQYAVDNPDATEETDAALFSRRQVTSVSPFVTWNTVDSFVKPTRGLYVNCSADYNLDIKEGLDNFIKYRAKIKYYRKILPKLVLACQGMAGYIQNMGNDSDLPDDQLFFLGGIADVRGFDENKLVVDSARDPAGGNTQLAGSLEARVDLGMNFELPLFVDFGTLKETDQSNEDIRWTVGTGIRYMTPVGPVGILYGHKLDKKENEDSGRIHFSIGYTF